jgi:pimeloyl-ACP methyl ester carboxylesterase
MAIRLSSHSSPELALALARGDLDAAILRREEHIPGLRFKSLCHEALIMHGEADQVVPFASSVPRAVDLLKRGSLKTYPGYPHGMLTTHADVLNPDLLSFIRS